MPTAYIHTIQYALASHQITNAMLVEDFPSVTEAEIYRNSGIKSRFSVDSGTIATDFAAQKANKIIDQLAIQRESMDFLIYCTEAPDYIAPASSTILHQKIGLPAHCGTFDLNFGCSGYTYGLLMAKSLIESGVAKEILFITADIPTQVIAKNDLTLRALFSDAVSVSLISSQKKGMRVGEFVFGTDGSGEMALRVANSGFNMPRNQNWFLDENTKDLPVGKMEMNGMAVFRFSLERVPILVAETLEKNHLQMKDIDLFVFHQASKIILKSLQRKLKIEDSKIFNNIENLGNTVSASIPIALTQAIEQGRIKRNANVFIAGFGIGYSWSATVLNTNFL